MQTNAKTARPGAERKRPDRRPKKQAQPRKAGPQTAQQTIPYRELFKDGICRVNDKLYMMPKKISGISMVRKSAISGMFSLLMVKASPAENSEAK